MSSMVFLGMGVVAVLAVLILWLMFTYNRFVSRQNKIDMVWDEVDEHLKLRHALVPNLLKSASGHMMDDDEIFVRIKELNSVPFDEMEDRDAAPIENELSDQLRRLRDWAVDKKELMLDQHFITTLGELVSMEGRASAACERHNALVREYNASIKSFPANVIAHFLLFSPCEMRIFGVREEVVSN